MLNWVIRHTDAIEDNYKKLIYSDDCQDLNHLISIIYNIIFLVIKIGLWFLLIMFLVEMCWVLINW